MTNIEDVEDQASNLSLAGLLAVHLVNQVLDEAYVIACVVRQSGQSWNYSSMLKSFKDNKDSFEDISFIASKGDSDGLLGVKKVDIATNIVTSTPQKISDGAAKLKMKSSLIGQGDEDFYTNDNELTKSTSMFINHLFDMSDVDVEHVNKSQDDDDMCILSTCPETDSPIHVYRYMSKIIMESCINAALTEVFVETHDIESHMTRNSSSSFDYSCYSFLSDALINDETKSLFLNEDNSIDDVNKHGNLEEENDIKCDGNNKKNYTSFNENAYLTLNRDYEQYSEEDGDPVVQDTKELLLQEVELMPAHTSEVDLFPDQNLNKLKDLKSISANSASANGSFKNNLVHRCRTHGSRLLACLRGWWRRKTPGKRRESRSLIRGLCPLSPDARCRASSLLKQSRMRSPSPSRTDVWKFNTIDEVLVSSSRRKEYTFGVRPEESGEYS